MANIFQIISSSETLQLDKEGRGDVTITVTNIAKSVAGRALIVPIGDTDESWLQIEGEAERELEAGIPEELKVTMELPKDAPEGELKFRIDVVSEVNPDDDFSEGPEITIVRPPASKLWLWILSAVLFLVIVGVVAWLVVSSGKDDGAVSEQQAADSVVEGQGDAAAEDADATARFMPNLMGLSREEAERQASALGLTLEVDELIGGESLTVSDQTPRPGQPIEEQGTVKLQLEADMPDLVGMEELEAGLSLVEAGFLPGDITYRVSDRQEAGKILGQSIAPQVESKAGTVVDIVVSLGACYWTPRFRQGFGLVSCRSGSAMSGLECMGKSCSQWQIYCCPYSSASDPDSKLTLSKWISRSGQSRNRKKAFLDGVECRGSDCPDMRVRYLESPRLEKGSECRDIYEKKLPKRCGAGQFVAQFACRGGKTCNEWSIRCCSGEAIAPD